MNRASWIAEYRVRQNNKWGRSRAALERFVPQIAGQVVELNAYATQSKRLADLQHEYRTTSVFEFLLRIIKPRVIVCAGTAASRAVRRLGLPRGSELIEARHFIYWGRTYEQDLANQVNRLLAVRE
ncbi:hypothetical protein [Polaromonas sp. A23]|uniref:hypothetical protein n=1 Tax=Polaromonas sp. A23 TaxID=1944133 RepID=UPI00111589CB|nr:hypothetical protein [Polaromonas sp. A23]